ncbi:hypothetical protein FV222_06785 [Methylobacterium sp. WL103]|uniref:hypothetical protein n=1 Tax=Methylobacterium sp. WL103 TaxID=2603891 RepID=UPI0011CC9598|nr:hypothetical protein [Methylobacterium sp. WL103]TXN05316.1 hypothetical protein FV222_06785 [Methylobacterium sp. WL103]
MSQSPEETRRELQLLMQTEGARIAYDTAKSICLDPKASATAKASAINSLLRVGGFDGKPEPDGDVPVEDMTKEQLARRIGQIDRMLASYEEPDGDLFA